MGTPNTNLVLAGTGAAGSTGASLVWVAPLTGTGTTAPTDATTALGAGWKDCGYIDTSGVTVNFSESKKDIYAYGVEPPVRELVTQSTETFDITFLENNTTVIELFYRLTLGSITVTSVTGALSRPSPPAQPASRSSSWSSTSSTASTTSASTLPKAQVTDRKGQQIQAGTEITYGTTMTVYPDGSGNATYNYHVIPALG
jgi:hypothetical protein